MLCPACAMASEVESYTISCVIRGHHNYIRKVLYCWHYEGSTVYAEGPFGSGPAAKQNQNVATFFWSTCWIV